MDELQQNFIGQFDATQNIMQTVQTNKKESDIWNEYFSMQIHYALGNGHVHPRDRLDAIIEGSAIIADKMIYEYNKRWRSA